MCLLLENRILSLISHFSHAFILRLVFPLCPPFSSFVTYPHISVMPTTSIALKFLFQECLKHTITFALFSIASEDCHIESDRQYYVPLVIFFIFITIG
jgi:hypothetical protein